MDVSDTERQFAILAAALAGVVHLLVPGMLLRSAQYGYGWVLDVEFRPRDGATGRVRLVGALLLGVAATLWRRYA
jgi:hypothetical protein